MFTSGATHQSSNSQWWVGVADGKKHPVMYEWLQDNYEHWFLKHVQLRPNCRVQVKISTPIEQARCLHMLPNCCTHMPMLLLPFPSTMSST